MGIAVDKDPVGNGRKGGLARVANAKLAIDLLWDNWRTGFADRYEELVISQSNGQKINGAQKEFMDRYEKNLEFVTPKRARVDGAGATQTPIINIIHYGD